MEPVADCVGHLVAACLWQALGAAAAAHRRCTQRGQRQARRRLVQQRCQLCRLILVIAQPTEGTRRQVLQAAEAGVWEEVICGSSGCGTSRGRRRRKAVVGGGWWQGWGASVGAARVFKSSKKTIPERLPQASRNRMDPQRRAAAAGARRGAGPSVQLCLLDVSSSVHQTASDKEQRAGQEERNLGDRRAAPYFITCDMIVRNDDRGK